MSTDRAQSSTLLKRQGAADQIADVLQDRVLDGIIRPGESLREVELAAEFEVARNTVREALRLLSRDGLVVHAVHRGVTVRKHSVHEIRDLYEARTLFQAEAGRLAGSLSPEDRDALQREVNLATSSLDAGDTRGWMTHNMSFHQGTVALLRNPHIDRMFASLVREIRLVLTYLEQAASRRWDEENQKLLDILDHKDEHAYRREITTYLVESCNEVVERRLGDE